MALGLREQKEFRPQVGQGKPRHVQEPAAAEEVEEEVSDQQRQDDDGVRWLALLLLKVAVILGNGIRARYALSRGERCPKCGHAY